MTGMKVPQVRMILGVSNVDPIGLDWTPSRPTAQKIQHKLAGMLAEPNGPINTTLRTALGKAKQGTRFFISCGRKFLI
jgi:hypothetical protein